MSADETTSATTPERRRMTRIPFRAPCHVSWGAERVQGATVDVALGGARAELPGAGPAVGQRCFVEIDLGDGLEPIETLARAVHLSDGHPHNMRLGLAFESLGVEALSHLRQIVQLNAPHALDARSELGAFMERPRSASRNQTSEGQPS